jgi:hypothetical protein
MDPPRSIATVEWPTRPRSRDEFLEALAGALDVDVAGIADELAERLTHSNLVLLHPSIHSRFVDDALIDYYTKHLPELIAQARPQMHVKCVQPIEWLGLSPAAQLLVWFRLKREPDKDTKPQAEEFITRVRKSAAPHLRVVRLHDLSDVTEEDMNEFYDLMNLADADRTSFREYLQARNPSTPKELFDAIDAYLPEVMRNPA